MELNDFRYIHQGRHLRGITRQESYVLQPVAQYTARHERALLILHGFGSSPAGCRLLIPQIKHYDAIVSPLLPGHGNSIRALAQSRASEWFTLAQEHCAALVNKYQHVDVLGLSLGGLIACLLSHEFPINHLYLLAPALKLPHLELKLAIARLAETLGFVRLRNHAGGIKHPENAELAYSQLPLSAIIEILQWIKNTPWRAPTCPIDLFLGRYDQVIDTQRVQELFSSLPNARTHWLEHSAHVLPLDNDLDAIVRCINILVANEFSVF